MKENFKERNRLENLNLDLDHNQVTGVSYLLDREGVILADVMGSGKTKLVINVLIQHRNEGRINKEKKAVVILPKSLLEGWYIECKKCAPDFVVNIYEKGVDYSSTEILLITYRKTVINIDQLKKLNVFIVVLDEGHKIKNALTKTSQIIKSWKPEKRILMTGTPLENKFKDLISLAEFITPNYQYLDRFEGATTFDKKGKLQIKNHLKSYTLRREQKDQTFKLPPKEEKAILCELSEKAKRKYKEIVDLHLKKTKRKYNEIANLHFRLDYRQILGLGGFGAIQQLLGICAYPDFDDKDNLIGNKYTNLKKILELLKKGDKVLIFVIFLSTISFLKEYIKLNFSMEVFVLEGKYSIKERSKIIEDFKKSPNNAILIISITMGGTGLNLPEANIVIHFEMVWNYSIRDQASARAHRRGQERLVTLYTFITRDTIEMSMEGLVRFKKNLCATVTKQFNHKS